MTLTPTLEDLATFVDPDSPVLTPDAAQVVYMDTSTPADGPRVSELWIRPVPPTTGTARQLTSGARDSAPAIAPDGRTISFVRHDEKGPNLVTIPVGGGPARQLTEGLKVTRAPAFSPDGTAIVFTARVDDRESDPPAPLVVDGDPEHKVAGAGWIGTARHAPRCTSSRRAGGSRCGSPSRGTAPRPPGLPPGTGSRSARRPSAPRRPGSAAGSAWSTRSNPGPRSPSRSVRWVLEAR